MTSTTTPTNTNLFGAPFAGHNERGVFPCMGATYATEEEVAKLAGMFPGVIYFPVVTDCDNGECEPECPNHVTRVEHEYDGEFCRESSDGDRKCVHGYRVVETYV